MYARRVRSCAEESALSASRAWAALLQRVFEVWRARHKAARRRRCDGGRRRQRVAGFGGHGEFVERPDDIAPALQRAIASRKPALVNVCFDPEAQAAGGLLGAFGSTQAAR